MKRSAKSTIDGTRIAAWISLLAILFTYAPALTATLAAATGACCTGGQCPIHGNHHPAKENPSQQSDDVPMDCEHHGHAANKMQSCKMSCCQTLEQPAIHAHAFLLMPVSHHSSLVLVSFASFVPTAINVSPAYAPLAPPPKSLVN